MHEMTSPPPSLGYRERLLHLDGVPLTSIADEVGTPAFVLSETALVANTRALADGLGRAGTEVRIRYCAKTNNEAGVLATLARLGCHCLVSHPAELTLALRCGFPPERLAYQRPLLTRQEIAEVLGKGVALLHVHRLEELPRIAEVATEIGRPADLSLRLRPAHRRASPLGRLGGRFGLPPAEALAAGREIRRHGSLRLVAVNFYLGTQQSSPRAFEKAIAQALRLVEALREECGQPIGELNLGGGVPSPSLGKLSPRRLWQRVGDRWPAERDEHFAARLGDAFARQVERSGVAEPPALAVEAGRSIVGNAGLLLTRVEASDGAWLYLDASSNYLAESILLFRRRILPLARRDGRRRFYHLSGSSLNTMDVLDLHRRLPPVAPGDLLALGDAGAYSISRARRYAGLSPPVYLLRADSTLHRIRRGEDLRDLAGPMVLPAGEERPG